MQQRSRFKSMTLVMSLQIAPKDTILHWPSDVHAHNLAKLQCHIHEVAIIPADIVLTLILCFLPASKAST